MFLSNSGMKIATAPAAAAADDDDDIFIIY